MFCVAWQPAIATARTATTAAVANGRAKRDPIKRIAIADRTGRTAPHAPIRQARQQ
jgi:hypothetical protein